MFLFLPLLLGTLLASEVPSEGSTAPGDSGEETRRLAESFLNGRALVLPAQGADYCIFLIGHAYGNHDDSESRAPARSLLASIEAINEAGPAFVALLGDNARKPRKRHVDPLRTQFAEAIDAPVFALPGEHDLFRGTQGYAEYYGPPYYRIELGRELFIVLNSGGGKATEISPEQLRFLKRAIEDAEGNDAVKNVVLLMHKVVWAGLPRYRDLRPRINNERSGGFWGAIYPELRELSGKKPVYVGSGDIGHKSYSFFLDRNPDDGITYFATGLADRGSDTIARIDSSASGEISVVAVSLTDRPVQSQATSLEGFTNWTGESR